MSNGPEFTPTQTPYPGPSAPVLGAGGLSVAALDYDQGGEGVSWHDLSAGIANHNLASDGGRTGSDVDVTPAGDIGWVQNGEWLEYTVEVEAAGRYDLGLLMGTKHDGRSVEVSFTRDGAAEAYLDTTIATANTGSYARFAENAAGGLELEAGTQTIRVAFRGNDQDFRGFSLAPEAEEPAPGPTPTPTPTQAPYPGPSAPVLGAGGLSVAALDYDQGGEGVSWHDLSAGIANHNLASDGGRTGSDVDVTPAGDIGWVQNGEWLEYTVEVEAAGRYDLGLLMGTKHDGRSVEVSFTRDGAAEAYLDTTIATANTGSYARFAENAAGGLELEAGTQTIRVAFRGNDQDFRGFSLAPEAEEPAPGPTPTPTPTQAPYPGPSAPVLGAGGLSVAALDYDQGGEGVSWHDLSAGIVNHNLASDGGRTGSDVDVTPDGDIGWVQNGEWLEYTVEVAAAGRYDLGLLMGTKHDGRSVEVSFTRDGAAEAYLDTTIATANTGSYARFAENAAGGLELEAGTQTIRVAFQGNDQDFRGFSLAPEAEEPAPGPTPTPTPTQAPYPGPSAPVLGAGGLSVAALDYDQGGEGVSWHDLSAGIVNHNLASDGGRTGSDVDVTPAGDIGWVQNGEWLEYTVEVEAAGRYDLGLLMGTKHDGRSVEVSFTRDGAAEAYLDTTIATANTGSYARFAENAAGGLELEAGTQTIRVAFQGNDQDFRSLTFTPERAETLSLAGSDIATVVDLAAGTRSEAPRILTLGDSITYGLDSPGGWRAPLWDDFMERGIWADLVGGYSNNPGPTLLDPDHQGKSGITATEVARSIGTIARDHPADIVTIMLGTNDVWRYSNAPDTVPDRLTSIIETLSATNPDVDILLATLTPRTNSAHQAQLDLINAKLPDVVSDARDAGIDVTLVDMSEIGTEDLYDEVHPSDAGYELMARIWGDAILQSGNLSGDPKAIDSRVVEVRGSEAGDHLLGDERANTLSGGGGNDRIEGRAGDDRLEGGSGRDMFVFAPGSGQDEILDFDAGGNGDLLMLAEFGMTRFTDVTDRLSDAGTGLRLDLGSGDSVLLHDLALGDLERENVLLA